MIHEQKSIKKRISKYSLMVVTCLLIFTQLVGYITIGLFALLSHKLSKKLSLMFNETFKSYIEEINKIRY
jgi:hypothetical protein